MGRLVAVEEDRMPDVLGNALSVLIMAGSCFLVALAILALAVASKIMKERSKL